MADEAEMRPADYAYLQTLPGNDVCVDCGRNKPDWGSPKLGILFCFECSGRHRHVSFPMPCSNWQVTLSLTDSLFFYNVQRTRDTFKFCPIRSDG